VTVTLTAKDTTRSAHDTHLSLYMTGGGVLIYLIRWRENRQNIRDSYGERLAMARRKTAQQARENWVAGMGNAGAKYEQGVRSVSVAPGQRAAQKKDKYLQGVQASVDTWARRVAAVDLGTWQNAAVNASSRLGTAASEKAGKYESNVTPVFAHMDSVLATVDNMPDNTLDQRIAKSGAFARGMAAYKGRAGS
jgi:hypothetical protein